MTQSDKTASVLFFRGCMWGLLIALPMWAAIYWTLWLVFG
jgi:hypothetical protein